MLHKSYLFNSAEQDFLLSEPAFKGFPKSLVSVRLVVPRELCAYFRINCAGVPRMKLAAYAQLQLQAMTPLASYGACIVRQGNWLHAWLWDKSIEVAFAEKHGLDRYIVATPLSLYSKPVDNGVAWLASPNHAGIEAQLWQSKQLIDSQWFDVVPTDASWGKLHAQIPELKSLGWPSTLPVSDIAQINSLQLHPWARNLIPRKRIRNPVNWNYIVPGTLALATTVLAGWGAWLYGQKEANKQAIEVGTQTQVRRLAELEPIQKTRQQTERMLEWINAVNALSPAPTTNEILRELADIVTRQGLLVRELEINLPTLQATLVAPATGSPRLTAVVGAIENHPWFYDARFVDVSGGTGFKFTWRMRPSVPSSPAAQQP